MTNLKKTFKKAFNKGREEAGLLTEARSNSLRQSKMNFKQRKDAVLRWAMKQRGNINPVTAKDRGTTVEMAYAVLIEHINASPTGDFCNIKQETIAKRMGRTQRTIQRAIYTLRDCGILYTKHNYKNTDRGNRRTVSYTIIAAFRKQFDRMKQYLNSVEGIASVDKILSFLGKHSQHVSEARLLESFNKAALNKQFIDTKTGEFLTGKEAAYEFGMEARYQMEGV